ncbi:MAG: MBL fold metallo-hydrolase [bacterium]|nr:MBL fold metallo-hydrolase [bacterium]
MPEKYFRIYKSEFKEKEYLGKITVFLADRPGSLAALASIFANYDINIIYFYYNRSEHPNRVLLEVRSATADSLNNVQQELANQNLFDGELLLPPRLELGILDTHSILNIEVQLEHQPGRLGKFATLLRDHKANFIYIAYNEDISATSANISLVTQDSQEVDRILKDMNEKGYHYSLRYKGAEQKEIEDIIGLNLVERFFFRLKKLLHTNDIDRLKKLVESSTRMSDMLVKFSQEAGKHLEAGEVFTNVLAFASVSLSKTGPNFSYRRLPLLPFGKVTFHAFRLPTGGNIYLLENDDEIVMLDGAYGLYYDDVKKMLKENGINPAQIQRIYLSHTDADHAGLSGYFADEFGTKVYLHPVARGIIENENRVFGSDTPLLDLNNYFTVLVNEFTQFRVPKTWNEYKTKELAKEDGFRIIDTFEIAGQNYKILESSGGHVPGNVFFVSEDSGLVFTGDYLLSIESLSPEDRANLNYPKFMMTSTNADSRIFKQEMEMLKKFISGFNARLQANNRGAIIVPGHGDYYPANRLK